MELWFVLAVISTILYSVSVIVGKKAINKLKPVEYGIIANIVGLLILIPYSFFLESPVLPSISVGWLWITLMEVFYVSGEFLNNYVFKKDDVSLTVPIISTAPLFTVLVAVTLLGETLSFIQGLAVGLIIFGIYVASLEDKGLLQPLKFIFTSKGAPMILVALLFGLAFSCQKVVLGYINTTSFLIILYLTSMFFWIIYFYKRKRRVIRHFKKVSKNTILITILASTFLFLQWPPYSIALDSGPASLVVPISFSGIFIIVLAGRVIFKEKHIKIRLLGTVLIVAGLSLLSI
jgi:drug/metabolite transporter (DMT)-like permease